MSTRSDVIVIHGRLSKRMEAKKRPGNVYIKDDGRGVRKFLDEMPLAEKTNTGFRVYDCQSTDRAGIAFEIRDERDGWVIETKVQSLIVGEEHAEKLLTAFPEERTFYDREDQTRFRHRTYKDTGSEEDSPTVLYDAVLSPVHLEIEGLSIEELPLSQERISVKILDNGKIRVEESCGLVSVPVVDFEQVSPTEYVKKMTAAALLVCEAIVGAERKDSKNLIVTPELQVAMMFVANES